MTSQISSRPRRVTPLRIAVALAAVVCVAEVGARFLGFGYPLLYRGGVAGYELVPDQSVKRLGKVSTINHLGTRGPDASAMPAPGVTRLLVLGDSVANGGTQTNDAQTWPMLAADRLNQMGRRVDVLNASAGGWAVQNEAAWLAEHGLMGAKLVVLEVNENDLDQPMVDAGILDHNPSFPTHRPMLALGEIMTRYVLPRLGLGGDGADPGASVSGFTGRNTPAVMAAVDQIARQVSAGGGRLVLLYWDTRGVTPPGAAAARETLLAQMASRHVPVVRPQMQKAPHAEALFRDQIHPNAQGNEFVAADLAPELAALHF